MENFLYENTFRFHYYRQDTPLGIYYIAFIILFAITCVCVYTAYREIIYPSIFLSDYSEKEYFRDASTSKKIGRIILFSILSIILVITLLIVDSKLVKDINDNGNSFAYEHFDEYKDNIVGIEKLKGTEEKGTFKIKLDKSDLITYVYVHDIEIKSKKDESFIDGYNIQKENNKLVIYEEK